MLEFGLLPGNIRERKETEARVRERVLERDDREEKALGTILLMDEVNVGKTVVAIVLMEGAQATNMARWFSRLDHNMAKPYQSVNVKKKIPEEIPMRLTREVAFGNGFVCSVDPYC